MNVRAPRPTPRATASAVRSPPPGTVDADGARGLATQRKEWLVQRAGWVLMALAVGLGLAFGEGGIVLRAGAIYLFMLVVLRLSGKRTLAQITPFDLVLLLIISEVTEPALMPDGEASFARVLLSITVLVAVDLAMGWATWRSKTLENVVEGCALVLVAHGEPLRDRLAKERVTLDEVLEAARNVGLTRLDQIRFAVLEADGEISVVPVSRPRFRRRR